MENLHQFLVDNLLTDIREVSLGYYVALGWACLMLSASAIHILVNLVVKTEKTKKLSAVVWIAGIALAGHLLSVTGSPHATVTFTATAIVLGLFAANFDKLLVFNGAKLKIIFKALVIFAFFSHNYWYEFFIPASLRTQSATVTFQKSVVDIWNTTIFSKVDWVAVLTSPYAKWLLIAIFAMFVFKAIKNNWIWLKTKTINFTKGFKRGFILSLNFLKSLPGRISGWWSSQSWWTGKKLISTGPKDLGAGVTDVPVTATSNLDPPPLD